MATVSVYRYVNQTPADINIWQLLTPGMAVIKAHLPRFGLKVQSPNKFSALQNRIAGGKFSFKRRHLTRDAADLT